jgi:hypothetical protein
VYDRARDAWYIRIEAADTANAWRLFAEYQVRRR